MTVSYLQENSYKTFSWFFNRNISGEKGLKWIIRTDENQGLKAKSTPTSKDII